MTATQRDTIAELQRTIAELRRERDAGLAREATLAETLARRNSEFGERIEHRAPTVDDDEALRAENQELRAAQAAGLEVLQAMIASPGDTQPVFDLIARQAADLCAASAAAVAMLDGTILHLATQYGYDPAFASVYATQFPRPVGSDTAMGRAILSHRAVQIEDLGAEPAYGMARAPGPWSTMAVPLLRGGAPLGVLAVGRPAIGRFPDNQVALLQTFAEQAVIAISSAETYRALQTRTSDLQETLEYQTATSDVLKVISRSASDLKPVLAKVAETAARLCVADQAAIYLVQDDMVRLGTNIGFPPEYEARMNEILPLPVAPAGTNAQTVLHRAIIERSIIHIPDVAIVPGYPDAPIRLGRQRTSLGVPLLREGKPVGLILLARQRVEPFTERQIELVSTFADQAVIAIENTRLLTEQQEALEQQTATAEVLQVINASPGNLTPVFDAILEKAHDLCDVAVGSLSIYLNGFVHTAATRGFSEEYQALLRHPYPAIGSHQTLMRGGPSRQTSDFRTVPIRPEMASSLDHFERMNLRTGLWVPLRKDGTALGCISAYRDKVQPFSEKEVALLENFAAQAVIAMENARLMTETREALEQQTATAEVLQVINSSPGNLQPVFEAILDKAHRICGATIGSLFVYDGEFLRAMATHGWPQQFDELMRKPRRPTALLQNLIKGERLFHIPDLRAMGEQIPRETTRFLVDVVGVRTFLALPLRTDRALLGTITAHRLEVRPFSEKEIALLENFAAQAVIAMENARLINEQREALEQQTATAEVLQVINSSPGDLAPVFDAMLQRATRLCGTAIGSFWSYNGEAFQVLASTIGDTGRTMQPDPGTRLWRIAHGESVVQIADVETEPAYRVDAVGQMRTRLAGTRTALAVALRKDETLVGAILTGRLEVRPFTDKQIALLQNFAAQAVVAMENARLLDEIRQRQQELRITFENMGDGVAMFDETQHLVAWNRKFQDILDVPDDIIARRQTFSEYLHYLAERGEYGPEADPEEHVRELIEQAGQSRTYERIRPDGRVIEIRHNPVPGGGFVLIYADITERKRNEAEIRAARDAAEQASRTIEAAYRELKTALSR